MLAGDAFHPRAVVPVDHGFTFRLGESVAFAPVQPGCLHRGDVAAVFGIYRVGAGGVAECLEPLSALELHSFQDHGYGNFAHADDLLVCRMLG